MTPAETKRLYERECRARRVTPQQDEFNLWHKNLRKFEVRDVDAALDSWNASTATDDKGESRSKWLPKPGELIPFVLAAINQRERAAAAPKDIVGWHCAACNYRSAGVIDRTDSRPRSCPRCAKLLTEFRREAAA